VTTRTRLLHKAEAAFVAIASGVAATGLLDPALVAPRIALIGALADICAGSVFVYKKVKGAEH
jgi:hypothetical protein